MKIGVFDSGMGGMSVTGAIEKALPELDVVFRNDIEHLPYGTKEPMVLLGYVRPIFQELISEGCELIVVACNTVTTNLIKQLRQDFPDTPLIGVEPLVETAVQLSNNHKIIVCATPATLRSRRYHYLKAHYAKSAEVIEPDCSDWTQLIEQNTIDDEQILAGILPGLEAGADVIVLGCTHYHWIETEINRLAEDRAVVIHPEKAVVADLRQVLAQRL